MQSQKVYTGVAVSTSIQVVGVGVRRDGLKCLNCMRDFKAGEHWIEQSNGEYKVCRHLDCQTQQHKVRRSGQHN